MSTLDVEDPTGVWITLARRKVTESVIDHKTRREIQKVTFCKICFLSRVLPVQQVYVDEDVLYVDAKPSGKRVQMVKETWEVKRFELC